MKITRGQVVTHKCLGAASMVLLVASSSPSRAQYQTWKPGSGSSYVPPPPPERRPAPAPRPYSPAPTYSPPRSQPTYRSAPLRDPTLPDVSAPRGRSEPDLKERAALCGSRRNPRWCLQVGDAYTSAGASGQTELELKLLRDGLAAYRRGCGGSASNADPFDAEMCCVKEEQAAAKLAAIEARNPRPLPSPSPAASPPAPAPAPPSSTTADAASLDGACTAGNGTACVKLALAYQKTDVARARSLFEKGCEKKEPMACFELGRIVQLGRGCKADPAQALKLFVRACEGGEPLACNQAGDQLVWGKGVARDPERALSLLRRAVSAELPVAFSSLGEMYENGWGVPKDLDRARELYRQACAKGWELACHRALLKPPATTGTQSRSVLKF